MKENERLTLTITDFNNLGCGIGRAQDGQVVFVRHTVPGDTVSISLIKKTNRYAVGRVEKILTPSPFRIENDCSAKDCGGCVYRNFTYQRELEAKRKIVSDAFRRAGLNTEVEEVRTDGNMTRYRNKAQFPLRKTKDGVRFGFFAAKTHRFVPCSDCPLQPDVFIEIAKTVCNFADEYGISAYEEATGKGLLRHLYLRQGKGISVCLILNGSELPAAEHLVARLTERFPEITGILLNENIRRTNVITGEKYTVLWGEEAISDTLCGKGFSIRPDAFYQVNHDACELLYRTAAEKAELTENDTVLDLYCGIGTVSLCLSERIKRIIGIEIVPAAVRCAEENAARNGIENARFFCGDASDAETFLSAAETEEPIPSDAVVFLDPPRKGTTPELMNALAARGFRKIVYISCNPETLARDCAYFSSLGYRISPATPVNLFPRTEHVETVVLMARNGGK